MKASGYFVGWNLSTIKSLVSNYRSATVGRMKGYTLFNIYIEAIHLHHRSDDNLHNCLHF